MPLFRNPLQTWRAKSHIQKIKFLYSFGFEIRPLKPLGRWYMRRVIKRYAAATIKKYRH